MAEVATDKIVNDIANRLQTDATFRDWTTANLGSNVNIYIGINPDDNPPESAYPLVAIFDIERAQRGDNKRVHTYVLSIGVGIKDSGQTTAGTPGSGQTFTRNGFPLVQAFRDQVELAINREARGQRPPWKLDADGETVNDNAGEFFKSYTLVTIEMLATKQSPIM